MLQRVDHELRHDQPEAHGFAGDRPPGGRLHLDRERSAFACKEYPTQVDRRSPLSQAELIGRSWTMANEKALDLRDGLDRPATLGG